jgi:hypothetical protein
MVTSRLAWLLEWTPASKPAPKVVNPKPRMVAWTIIEGGPEQCLGSVLSERLGISQLLSLLDCIQDAHGGHLSNAP